jgi:hypothetical protein
MKDEQKHIHIFSGEPGEAILLSAKQLVEEMRKHGTPGYKYSYKLLETERVTYLQGMNFAIVDFLFMLGSGMIEKPEVKVYNEGETPESPEELLKQCYECMKWKQKRVIEVLDDLLKAEGGLSGRELDFIEDMDSKRNMLWTEKQIDWLDRIYEKVCQ